MGAGGEALRCMRLYGEVGLEKSCLMNALCNKGKSLLFFAVGATPIFMRIQGGLTNMDGSKANSGKTCNVIGCHDAPRSGRAKWCEKHYYRNRRHGNPLANHTPATDMNLSERFWRHVPKQPDGECWEWQGTRQSHGYGHLRWGGKQVYAHRVAYLLANGQVPRGVHVMHSCDNPPCVNPQHLSTGSRTDNMQDMVRRGRQRHGGALFGWGQVEALRERYRGGERQIDLAVEFGVSPSSMHNLISGKTYRTPNGFAP
jgi:hypothetical protein